MSFVCDLDNQEVTRQADYTIASTQVVNPGGTASVLVNKLSACKFTYNQGTNSRNGILQVDLQLSAVDSQGATNNIRVIEQIQVPNIP